MQQKRIFIVTLVVILIVGVLLTRTQRQLQPYKGSSSSAQLHPVLSAVPTNSVPMTDADWQKLLTPQQYNILRQAGTEVPFSGALEYEKRKGTYYSVGCNEPVFRSEQKYDSGTGWPSFWAPIHKDALTLRDDSSLGEDRTEVLDKCGSHLGHVFDDGPQPTGKRYCMNSLALYFVPDKNQ